MCMGSKHRGYYVVGVVCHISLASYYHILGVLFPDPKCALHLLCGLGFSVYFAKTNPWRESLYSEVFLPENVV